MSIELDGEMFKTLIDHLHDGVYLVNLDRVIQYWSKGAERITGYTAEEVAGHRCMDNILEHVNDEGTCLCKSLCPLAHSMRDGEERHARVYLKHKEGHRVPVVVHVSPLRNAAGEIVGALESFQENAQVPASIREVEDLKKQLYLCPVTGVPNRRYANDVLQQRFEALTQSTQMVGLIFLDVDHFKEVNDKYGHPVGDVVLKMVAQTLSQALRSYDFVARWGGEEFILLAPIQNSVQVFMLSERLRVLIQSASRNVSQHRLSVTVSIGAVVANSGSDLKKALQRADELMYESKKHGRNRVTAEKTPVT